MNLTSHYSLRLTIFALICWMVSISWALAKEPIGTADQGPLVVLFEKNQARLHKEDTTRMRQVFGQVTLNDKGRIFVVGYADNSGSPSINEKLAMERAQIVRKLLVHDVGLDSEKVIAIGRGVEDPVGDNSIKVGRAKNRRAEIYISDSGFHPTPAEPAPPEANMPVINALLAEIRELVRRDQWDAALEKLQQAHALGGEYVGQWHALYGIIGFMKGVTTSRVRVHLEAALKYDPHNADARDFLSRIEARENVSAGRVNATMGNSAQAPIAVSTMAQQYEYLSLFDASPRYHHRLEHLPVDVWECMSSQGEPVVYYFDHGNVYAWAFSSNGASAQVSVQEPVREIVPASQSPTGLPPGPSMVPVHVFSGSLSRPQTIWESKLFR